MTGSQTNAGVMSSFGYNVGVQNQSGFFGDSNGITGGFGKAVSIVDRTPKFVLGLLSGAIGVAGVAMAFKKGKKPPKAKTSNFLSKLNPMNWFKKTK